MKAKARQMEDTRENMQMTTRPKENLWELPLWRWQSPAGKCNRCRKVKEFARLFKLSPTSLPQVDTNGARSCSEERRAKYEERHGE